MTFIPIHDRAGIAWLGPLLLVGLLLGCYKDRDEPGCNEPSPYLGHQPMVLPYLPATPGSWWHYSDGHVINTNSSFSLQPVLSTSWDPNRGVAYCCTEGTAYMCLYDGHPLYGYVSMHAEARGTSGETCNERLLSEDRGDSYSWGGSHYGRTLGRTIATDTAVTLSDGTTYSPCLIVKRVPGIASNYFDIAGDYTLEWYARDVGLVKSVRYAHHDLASERELTAYHIEH